MLKRGLPYFHSINEATHWGGTAQDEHRIGTEVLDTAKRIWLLAFLPHQLGAAVDRVPSGKKDGYGHLKLGDRPLLLLGTQRWLCQNRGILHNSTSLFHFLGPLDLGFSVARGKSWVEDPDQFESIGCLPQNIIMQVVVFVIGNHMMSNWERT
jgi:hypothetical protein